MSKNTFENFIKIAVESGVPAEDAVALYDIKLAEDMPVAPEQASELPPELEQMIQQLPPEAIQQLIAELEQQMAMQQQGGQLAEAAPMEEMPKQAELLEPLIKQPAYVDGFIMAAKTAGFNDQEIYTIYKSAVEITAPEFTFQQKIATLNPQAQMHLAGFVSKAENLGLASKQAAELYLNVFNQ